MGIRSGVCEWCLPIAGPFGVTLAGKAGFEGVQLGDLNGIAAGFPLNQKSVQEGYLQAAADAHVTLQAIHPYGLQRQGTMLSVEGTPGWDDAKTSIEKSVDACVDMGIPELMLSSFFSSMVCNDWEIGVYAKHLNYACDYAEDRGVIVSYESGLPLTKIFRMIELTNGRVKVCYDTRNPITLGVGEPWTDIPILGKNHITHFHVKDCPENMQNWCLIGDGVSRLPEVAKIIQDMEYSGWVISENDYSFLAAQKGDDFLKLMKEDVGRIKALFCEQG